MIVIKQGADRIAEIILANQDIEKAVGLLCGYGAMRSHGIEQHKVALMQREGIVHQTVFARTAIHIHQLEKIVPVQKLLRVVVLGQRMQREADLVRKLPVL